MFTATMFVLMLGGLAAVGLGFPRLKRNLRCMATGKSLCQCRRQEGACV